MKRCWFAVALLILLLIAGLWVTDYMGDVHSPIAETVARAGDACRTGNWPEAQQSLTQARESWEASRKAVAVFADHAPMEEVDALFAQLEVVALWQDGPGFSSLCAYLSEMLEAIGEAHSPSWWNIL